MKKKYLILNFLGILFWLYFYMQTELPMYHYQKIDSSKYIFTQQNISQENQWSMLTYFKEGFQIHPGESEPSILNITTKKEEEIMITASLNLLDDHFRDSTLYVILTIVINNDTIQKCTLSDYTLSETDIILNSNDSLSVIVDKGENSYHDLVNIFIYDKKDKVLNLFWVGFWTLGFFILILSIFNIITLRKSK